MANLQYEINGNGLNTLQPVVTSETHSEFYDYSSSSNSEVNKEAHHGYWEKDVATMLLHQDSNSGSYAVMISYNKPDSTRDQSIQYGARLNFSENIDADTEVLVEDDPGDTYATDHFDNSWGAATTDGGMIDATTFLDVTFTIDTPAGADNAITDFRLITSDGSAPDGGGVAYAGTSGSIRLVLEGIASSPVSTGDLCVMLTEDLAVHGKP